MRVKRFWFDGDDEAPIYELAGWDLCGRRVLPTKVPRTISVPLTNSLNLATPAH